MESRNGEDSIRVDGSSSQVVGDEAEVEFELEMRERLSSIY